MQTMVESLALTVFLSSLCIAGEDVIALNSIDDLSKLNGDHQIRLEAGELIVVIGNHVPRPNYEGIQFLAHKKRGANIFNPICAGMIGVRRTCKIEKEGEQGARITSGEGAGQVIETFKLAPLNSLDYTVEFNGGKWNNTNYMNGVSDNAIYLRKVDGSWYRHLSPRHGTQASIAPEGVECIAPEGKKSDKYPHGSDSFRDGFCDTRFDPKFPLFYGRVDDMVLIYMVERKYGESFFPYMSPTGSGGKNPAWDFRFRVAQGKHRIRMRACYKPWVSQEDVVAEYETWTKSLDAGASEPRLNTVGESERAVE